MKNNKNAVDRSKKRKKNVLGKGIDALIPNLELPGDAKKTYLLCDIELIRPNRYQPRIRFSEKELMELADSIKEQGIIQPLVVRKDSTGYELIAGERRWRASKLANLKKVPVVIKDISETEMLEVSIVENIQREDLNPIEEAEAYKRLMTEFKLTQEQVAGRVGKSRSAVANFLRLRQLPDQIQESILDKKLSMGHARALLGADTKAQQQVVWRSILSKGLSVRNTEALIHRLKSKNKKNKKSLPDSDEIYLSSLSETLSQNFGTKIQIIRRGKKGRIEIEFYSDNDLDHLIERLKSL